VLDDTPERERETFCLSSFFYHFNPTLFKKRVCGHLLITSLLVLLFSFEVPLKNNIKKKEKEKEKNKRQQRRGFVCVFFSFVRGAL
jgi:hypothetical protein